MTDYRLTWLVTAQFTFTDIQNIKVDCCFGGLQLLFQESHYRTADEQILKYLSPLFVELWGLKITWIPWPPNSRRKFLEASRTWVAHARECNPIDDLLLLWSFFSPHVPGLALSKTACCAYYLILNVLFGFEFSSANQKYSKIFGI